VYLIYIILIIRKLNLLT